LHLKAHVKTRVYTHKIVAIYTVVLKCLKVANMHFHQILLIFFLKLQTKIIWRSSLLSVFVKCDGY